SVRARGWGCRFLTGSSSDTTGALRSKVRWAPEPRLASTCPSTANRMSEPTLLLVDDEQPVLNALIRLLRKEPFRVLTAASADEALQILDKEEVQVVISDFRMPGKSGIELLREVKQRYPATVRCVMSGYANGHVIMDSINVGEVYRFLPISEGAVPRIDGGQRRRGAANPRQGGGSGGHFGFSDAGQEWDRAASRGQAAVSGNGALRDVGVCERPRDHGLDQRGRGLPLPP